MVRRRPRSIGGRGEFVFKKACDARCGRPALENIARIGTSEREPSLQISEHIVILNGPGRAGKDSGLEFKGHEGVFRCIMIAADPKPPSGREAESRVIRRMPQHNDRVNPQFPAPLKARAHQGRADSSPLMPRFHR